MYRSIVLTAKDNVATALEHIPQTDKLQIKIDGNPVIVSLSQPIQFGHKFAINPIEAGENIIKYGEIIGRALTNITPGEHVHVHNLEGTRGRGDK